MKNIKVDYKGIIRDSNSFEKAIERVVKNIDPYVNIDDRFDYFTSMAYLNKINSEDIFVGTNTNLKEFPVSNNMSLIRFLLDIYPGHSIVPTGHFLYPVTGYMSWHTNSNLPGKRVYVNYVDVVGCSGFKYVKNGTLFDSVDTEHVTIREFVPDEKDPLWHAVYSNCNRYSFGFRVIDLK